MQPNDEAIERFLATGELERGYPGWPGSPAERRTAAEHAVREVLARIVTWRARHAPLAVGEAPSDADAVVRGRAQAMVRGLLHDADADAVLQGLPRCVRVVTPTTFPSVIAELPPRTAWDLANLLLDALGAPPLADDTPELDGLCRGALCVVLPSAFSPPGELDDVLVHELAHVLHAVHRGAFGLSPAAAPLLRVAAHDRETFAWACELWSAISREPRLAAVRLRAWEAGPAPEDARVDVARLRATLETAAAGAGWGAVRTLTAQPAAHPTAHA